MKSGRVKDECALTIDGECEEAETGVLCPTAWGQRHTAALPTQLPANLCQVEVNKC